MTVIRIEPRPRLAASGRSACRKHQFTSRAQGQGFLLPPVNCAGATATFLGSLSTFKAPRGGGEGDGHKEWGPISCEKMVPIWHVLETLIGGNWFMLCGQLRRTRDAIGLAEVAGWRHIEFLAT